MKREIESDLLTWKNRREHWPLLLRGARQVGKSFVIEQFGKNHFKNLATVNFELEPEYMACFISLHPSEIIQAISLMKKQPIIPGETLLFLDEIQECPNAIKALRYFKEQMPELHVIGAGSLLEFTLNDADFRMPVGRIQFIYLKPLSFREYLTASGNGELVNLLASATLENKISEPIHQHLLKLLREYFVLGGMPEVLKNYLEESNLTQSQNIQTALLSTYRKDFGKYASRTNHKYLQQLFEKIPVLIGQRVKYSKIDPEARSRELKTAFENLKYAGLIYPIYATTASGLPLISLINEKKIKMIFLDVGLIKRASDLDINLLLQEDLLLMNNGAVAEQFVGQELLAYSNRYEESHLFFWERDKPNSTAEVDFVITVDSRIIPIEVKAGTSRKLKSLQMFMEEKKSKIALRISQLPLEFDGKILSIPLYMISEIERLVKIYGQ